MKQQKKYSNLNILFYGIILYYKMIGTKFTNNLKSNKSVFDDPFEWAIAKNLAYASIRDDIEKIIKQTNENSADVYVNAESLVQTLKANKINQYIEANKVTQKIDLTDSKQLNQIFMNSNVFQTINYIRRDQIVNHIQKSIKSDLNVFFGNKYAIIRASYNGKTNFLENFGCVNYSDVKKTMIQIANKIISYSTNENFVVDNTEGFLKKGSLNKYRFPIDFKGNNTSDAHFVDLPYLIFHIKNDDVGGFKDNNEREYLIILLNLVTLNLYNNVKKTDSKLLGKTLQDKDLLFRSTTKFTEFDLGKINRLILRSNELMPKNKLFN